MVSVGEIADSTIRPAVIVNRRSEALSRFHGHVTGDANALIRRSSDAHRSLSCVLRYGRLVQASLVDPGPNGAHRQRSELFVGSDQVQVLST